MMITVKLVFTSMVTTSLTMDLISSRNRGQGGTTREHFTPMTDLQQAPVICRTQPVSVIELYCLEDPVLQVSFSLRTDFVKLCTSMIS
jgi:hypothetical protein